MAYYPNFYGQQPYPYQDQLNQLRNAPMQMPGQFQQPMQPRSESSPIVWVQGEAGAKAWFVNPGATVVLMDSDAPRLYLKQADMNGMPSMKTFELIEVSPDKPAAVAEPGKFVTIDEYNQFRNEVLSRLEDLAQPVEVSVQRKRKGAANDGESSV